MRATTTITLTRIHQLWFYEFNARIANARADYKRYPNRACKANGCTYLFDNGECWCTRHLGGSGRARLARAMEVAS